MRKVIQKIGNRICRRRLERCLPGILAELKAYGKGSETTGTQPITLWMAVRGILKHRPQHILESGTGSSTLVLAAAVQKLRSEDPSYHGRITSMESVEAWFDLAQAGLPEKYRDVVEIVLGPREKFEMGFFRGYIHGNIPRRDYAFVLLDGPKFWDEHGLAFCADIFRAMELSAEPVMRGVVDGRVSSVFVLQSIFGARVARYYHGLFAASFAVPKIDFREAGNRATKDFACSPFGRLTFRKFRN